MDQVENWGGQTPCREARSAGCRSETLGERVVPATSPGPATPERLASNPNNWSTITPPNIATTSSSTARAERQQGGHFDVGTVDQVEVQPTYSGRSIHQRLHRHQSVRGDGRHHQPQGGNKITTNSLQLIAAAKNVTVTAAVFDLPPGHRDVHRRADGVA